MNKYIGIFPSLHMNWIGINSNSNCMRVYLVCVWMCLCGREYWKPCIEMLLNCTILELLFKAYGLACVWVWTKFSSERANKQTIRGMRGTKRLLACASVCVRFDMNFCWRLNQNNTMINLCIAEHLRCLESSKVYAKRMCSIKRTYTLNENYTSTEPVFVCTHISRADVNVCVCVLKME